MQGSYRNHPLYVLEKHLKKHQMLRPHGPVLGMVAGAFEEVATRMCLCAEDICLQACDNSFQCGDFLLKRSQYPCMSCTIPIGGHRMQFQTNESMKY